MADVLRAVVLAVPGVASLHSGPFGEVATYLAGRKVEGVRIRPDRIEVDVVLEWGSPALATADALRAAAATVTGTPIDVYVQDFTAPPGCVTDARAAPASDTAEVSPRASQS